MVAGDVAIHNLPDIAKDFGLYSKCGKMSILKYQPLPEIQNKGQNDKQEVDCFFCNMGSAKINSDFSDTGVSHWAAL